MRLIDADKLKNHYAWWNNEEKELFDAIVDAQPTAFDVDKVVKELKAETTALEDDYGDYVECIPESIVLKIVKGGGVNERD